MIEEISSWFDLAMKYQWAGWVLVGFIVAMTVAQSIKVFVRGAFPQMPDFWRTWSIRSFSVIINFFVCQYILTGSFDEGMVARIAGIIAITQILAYEAVQYFAINKNIGWLLMLLKIRRVRSGKTDKYVDSDDKTICRDDRRGE